MTGIQNEYVPERAIQPEYVNSFYNNIIFQKIDILEQQLSVINKQINKNQQNRAFFCPAEMDKNPYLENERKKGKVKKNTVVRTNDDWQGSRKIVERALEILTDWEDVEDIKMQIQYAAILVGKIDNLKKKDVIHADDTRNKICTLLRNVIRLNASEEILSKDQISVLKEGFSFVTAEKIQREDLFLLNRKMHKKGLPTMPAWE